ncbi:MAG TPA: hypothetical protein VGE01_05880 [Fimbriimonas sp.]
MLSLVPLLALSSAGEVAVFDAWANLEGLTPRQQWDRLHALSALQGLANRDRPRLYVNLVGEQGRIDRYWWDYLSRDWMKGATVARSDSFEELVLRFPGKVKGLVVWREEVPASSNVASTVAGVEGLLPVRYDPAADSLYSKLKRDLKVRVEVPEFTGKGMIPGTGIPTTGSAKCDAYLWAAERYLRTGRCNPLKMGYYPDAFWLKRPNGLPIDRTLLSNHDYFIAHKGFLFDLGSWHDESPDDDPNQKPGTDAETLQRILRLAYEKGKGKMIHVGGFTPWDLKYTDFTGMKNGGVATEWRYAEILSCFNAYMDADAPGLGPMANASFFQHFPLRREYKQPKTEAPSADPRKFYAAFYVGDYDSAAWLYRMMPELWDDPNRGAVPLSWAFNPNLADRFPVGMHRARETATPNDVFITGDSGAGYLNPGYLVPPRKWSELPSGLDAWIEHCRPYYRRWGLEVTGFVIDGNAPEMSDAVRKAYAKLSPGGVIAQKVPEQSEVQGVPFMRMGSDLDGGNLERSAAIVLEDARKPGLRVYRTILWSPTQHKNLMERVRRENPNVEFVTVPALMEMVRSAADNGGTP